MGSVKRSTRGTGSSGSASPPRSPPAPVSSPPPPEPPRSTKFAAGVSGNPGGRPRGSRNRATVMAEQLIDGDAEQLVGKLIDLARKGKPWALRLVVDRIIPARRRSVVEVELPSMERAEDIAHGIAAVIGAAAAGEITLEQAREFCGLLEAQRRILEASDLEVRIEALEREK